MSDIAYHKLLGNIDAYIRKHYQNLLIKGLLLSSGLLLAFFLIFSLLESWAYFSIPVRTTFFYSYLGLSLIILSIWIFIPLLKLWRLSRRLDRKEAARRIGEFFPDLSDKVLNTLQLKDLENSEATNQALLKAVIEQRAGSFGTYNFKTAIRFSSNKKYFPFVLPVFLILIVILLASPGMITEPAGRMVNYSTRYEPQAPFNFVLLNDTLEVVENDDFTLRLKMEGEEIPAEIWLTKGSEVYRMKKEKQGYFYYHMKNLREPFHFHFSAEDFASAEYQLRVLPRPAVENFEIEATYPSYTGKENERFKNTGDLLVPEGTKLKWIFDTKDTEELFFVSNEEGKVMPEIAKNRYELQLQLRENLNYSILSTNAMVKTNDSLHYSIRIIPDAFPLIRVSEFRDSLDERRIYIKGFIKDDYGFTSLNLIHKRVFDGGESGKSRIEIGIQKDVNQQQFFFAVDIQSFNTKPGEELHYYFEVHDNDAINGPKSSKSQMMVFKTPTNEEVIEERKQEAKELEKRMEDALKKASEIEKELEKLQKELKEKENLDWQDKEKMKEVLEKNQELLKELEQIKEDNERKTEKEKELREVDEELLEKQRELQELMDKLLTPEMKEMLEEMQKMMEEQMKKEDAEKMLEDLQVEQEDLENQLERELELFKEMEFQMKLQDAIDKLDTLQKMQQELSEQSQNKDANQEELKQKQEELNKQFEKFRKDMEEMRESNQKLESPHQLDDTQSQEDSIQNQMQESSESLEKGKQKKAGQQQEDAADQMQQLKEKMEQMQSEMAMQEMGEDMRVLREILDNLVESSFRQEEIMKELRFTPKDDPRYPELIKEQKKLKDDMEMIEDSLLALSKRQASIAPYINKEIAKINRNMAVTLADLQEMNTIGYVQPRQKDQILTSQQHILSSVNQLALMLAEALEQMQQQQMQMQSQGNKSCKKPKQGNSGGMKNIRQMQQELQKQMEQMRKSMQNGQKPGKQGKQGKGKEQMSEEMARMAAQQELIRRKIQEYQDQLRKQGLGEEAQSLQKIAEQMEENETDLVNNILTAESLKRQEEIMTRLLEAEKAERERGEKEERKSNEGEEKERSEPENFDEYKRLKSKEVELLKTIPINMKLFYRNKVNNYFESKLNQDLD